MPLTTYLKVTLVVIIPVAVEKLAQREFSEITSRQEGLQTIFPSLLDIFYHPIFDFFQKNHFFNSHRISQQLFELEHFPPDLNLRSYSDKFIRCSRFG